MTSPEQHAATVRDGERIAAELYAAAEKGGVMWSQLACEQMSRTVHRLVALALEAERLAGRADELERELAAARAVVIAAGAERDVSDEAAGTWGSLLAEEQIARQAAEARADELQHERDAARLVPPLIRATLEKALRLDMTKPPVTQAELRQAIDLLPASPSFYSSVGGMEQLMEAQADAEQARREADQLREKLDRLANVESTWELLQQNDRLRAALEEIAGTDFQEPSDFSELGRIARAALAGVQAEDEYCVCGHILGSPECCNFGDGVQADNKDAG